MKVRHTGVTVLILFDSCPSQGNGSHIAAVELLQKELDCCVIVAAREQVRSEEMVWSSIMYNVYPLFGECNPIYLMCSALMQNMHVILSCPQPTIYFQTKEWYFINPD